MADDGIGGGKDAVTVTLGGQTAVLESYEVHTSVLTQPSAFSLRMGWGDVARELIAKAPPNTPFTIRVGDVIVQTGKTDGFEAQDGEGATSLTITGRDSLAPLHDAFVQQEITLTNATYAQIVQKAFDETGLHDATLIYTNEANRKAITGTNVQQNGPPRTTDDLVIENSGGGTVKATTQAKLGERWFEFLRRHLDRAGLFLWATGQADPQGHPVFVLSEPNTKQAPAYRIVRRRGQTRNEVSVTRASYKNDTTHRFSEAAVYARGSGKKFGRAKTAGDFVDDEMTNWGYLRQLVIRDANCKTKSQAEFVARRKLAESRRSGWHLTYTLAGHTVPSLSGSGSRAVWAPDTIVDVVDDEYGIKDTFYVESVTFSRPPTTTQIVLMRKTDLIFGADE